MMAKPALDERLSDGDHFVRRHAAKDRDERQAVEVVLDHRAGWDIGDAAPPMRHAHGDGDRLHARGDGSVWRARSGNASCLRRSTAP